MTIEQKAHEAHNANRALKEKYHIPYNAWIDWFTLGYRRAEKDNKEVRNNIQIHLNSNYYGNRKYYFTKDDKHCLSVEYNPTHDFGKGSPSGARIESVEIHTNNGFVFNEELKEISLSEVPECIIELLIYLK